MRWGGDYTHPDGGHTYDVVYSEMLLQVCRDYPGLPDARTLSATEIRFFYEGGRASLKTATRVRD